MHSEHGKAAAQFNLGAAVLAWLWPGLGHISLGQRRRGRLVMLGVLFLFISGLLIGGLDVVDHREDHLWFLAQGLCGPIAFVADYLNQHVIKGLPETQRLQAVALNKPNEMGTLFCALAGLMNLVVMLDALHGAPRPEQPRDRRRPVADPGETAAGAADAAQLRSGAAEGLA